MDFIGGTVSGAGSVELSTTWAAWTMVLLYSRFGLLFALNVFLVVTMVVECNLDRNTETTTVVSKHRLVLALIRCKLRIVLVSVQNENNCGENGY